MPPRESWTSLPKDNLRSVLSFLGTCRDLETCARVCRIWNQVATEPPLWHEVAVRKYGKLVAQETGALYSKDWKVLVGHDNRLGALPTIHVNKPSYYLHNEAAQAFYCCLVTQIKWDRVAESVLVYLEARAERGLQFSEPLVAQIRWQHGQNVSITTGFWEGEESNTGHLKGCVKFHDTVLSNLPAGQGRITFCLNKNFQSIDLPSWAELSNSTTYTTHASPFENDSQQLEKERWQDFAPEEILYGDINTSSLLKKRRAYREQRRPTLSQLVMERIEQLRQVEMRREQMRRDREGPVLPSPAERERMRQDREKWKMLLTPRITAWSTDNGQKNDLPTMLGTLSSLLWHEANWKPVKVKELKDSDLMTKKAFHKASRIVHPDKAFKLNIRNRVLAGLIFDELCAAKRKFDESRKELLLGQGL